MSNSEKTQIALTSEQQQMVADNIGLAYYMADKMRVRRPDAFKPQNMRQDKEDLQSIACIALCKAAKLFQPELGFAFSSYACKSIENEITRYIDHTNYDAMAHVSVGNRPKDSENDDLDYIESIADPVNQAEKTERSIETEQVFEQTITLIQTLLDDPELPMSQRRGLEYLQELYAAYQRHETISQTEYCKQFGVSRQSLIHWINTAKKRIRTELKWSTMRKDGQSDYGN